MYTPALDTATFICTGLNYQSGRAYRQHEIAEGNVRQLDESGLDLVQALFRSGLGLVYSRSGVG